MTLDSWEVVSVRASSGHSILPVALETLRIPDWSHGGIFVSFEKVKDYLGPGSLLGKLVEDGYGRLDLA